MELTANEDRSRSDATPELSIVLPAHNELTLLGSTVMNIVQGLRRRQVGFEVVVVENGSTDGTLRLARTLAAQIPEMRVIALGRANYGSALAAGFTASRGKWVANFDVDYYDLGFLDLALAAMAEDASIVLASKRAPGARDERPLQRRALTALFSALTRRVLGLNASDAHGMKVISRASVAPIVEKCQLRGSLFDLEMVLRCEHARVRIVELPATVRERRPARTSVTRRTVESAIGVAKLARVLRQEQHPTSRHWRARQIFERASGRR